MVASNLPIWGIRVGVGISFPVRFSIRIAVLSTGLGGCSGCGLGFFNVDFICFLLSNVYGVELVILLLRVVVVG